MSGIPTLELVEQFIEASEEAERVGAKLHEIGLQVSALTKEQIALDDRLRKAETRLVLLAKQMDVTSSGNHGYENRLALFAALIIRATKARFAPQPPAQEV